MGFRVNPQTGMLEDDQQGWGLGDSYQGRTSMSSNPDGSISGTPNPNGGIGDISSILGSFGGGAGGNANGSGIGWNVPTINAGIGAFGQLGGLYLGLKQLGLAKDSFKLQKEAYRTNLANSTRSYNTQVADRIAGRSYGSEEERQAALKAAQLPTTGY